MLRMTSLLLILAGRLIPGGAKVTVKGHEYTNIGLNGKVFTDNVAFEYAAASVLGCAVQCSQHGGCVTFTFHQNLCRGHDAHVTASASSSPGSGARSFGRQSGAALQRDVTCEQTGVKQLTDTSLGLDTETYCDGDWLVFQKRQDGSVDFYRDWEDYVNGFGDAHGEFWLGLEALHLITTSGLSYELRVNMAKWDGSSAFASYSNFSVGPASDNYALNYDAFLGGTAGDSLSFHKGLPFTTRDADHDSDPENCAVTKHGAWWYKNCHNSNLNGDYFETDVYILSGVIWSTFGGWYSGFLQSCRMMIRPSVD